MKALSLFSGIGGLDLAAEAAGIQTVAFCEREPFCQDVLHEHWPDVPIYDDVTQLRGEQIGRVDVIHGGFPCQPFSVAGKRKGKDDERFLWGEFSRLIGEIEPRWVVAENVLGIMSLAADDVCKDLEARGYEVEIFCYEALSVGALHRRMRVFFVAHSRRELGQRPDHARELREADRGRTSADVGQTGDVRDRAELFSGTPRDDRQVVPSGTGIVRNSDGVGQWDAEAGDRDTQTSDRETASHNERSSRNSGEREPISDAEYDGSPAAERRGTNASTTSGAQAPEQLEGVHRRAESAADAEISQDEQHSIGHETRSPITGVDSASRFTAQSRLGRVAYGFPRGVDLHIEPDIPRVAQGVKDRAARLKALGNAVVPAQAYPIFKAIVEEMERNVTA